MLMRFTIFLCIAFLMACTPTKRYAEVHYGRAGGVTGDKQHYVVNKIGELRRKNDSKSEFVLVKTLTETEQKKLYKLLKAADVDQLNINEPHNIYCFLELKETDESPAKKLVWGHPESKLSKEMVALQDYLFSLDQKKEEK